MHAIEVQAGEGRYLITLCGWTTEGCGICAFLTGGERPHNGGTVVANPRLKSNAKHGEDRTADLWVSGVPGHKDTEIGMPVAKHLAVALNEAVSLTSGIHMDHARPDEVKLLCDNCFAAADKFIAAYLAERAGKA